jgi:hypothetical protein
MPTLADLHRRYDGPVPEEELAAAKAGGAERLARLRARGRLHFWRQQVKWALAAVRVYRLAVAEGRRRLASAKPSAQPGPDHDHYARLLADLASARRHYRAHLRDALAHERAQPACAADPGCAEGFAEARAASARRRPAFQPDPGVAMMRDLGRALLNEAAE